MLFSDMGKEQSKNLDAFEKGIESLTNSMKYFNNLDDLDRFTKLFIELDPITRPGYKGEKIESKDCLNLALHNLMEAFICFKKVKNVYPDYYNSLSKIVIKNFNQLKARENYAETYLGYCYQFGLGVDQNINKALKIYKKNKNYQSEYLLGLCYYDGIGLRQDRVNAMNLINRSSCNGNEVAKEFLSNYKLEKFEDLNEIDFVKMPVDSC